MKRDDVTRRIQQLISIDGRIDEWPPRYADEFLRISSETQHAPLQEGETAAISFTSPKTTALCFDRVWGMGEVPQPIGFIGDSTAEIAIVVFRLIREREVAIRELLDHDQLLKYPDALRWRAQLLSMFHEDHGKKRLPIYQDSGGSESESMRILAESIARERNRAVVPVYDSVEIREREYRVGEHEVVVAVLSGLDVVKEDKLTWRQVHEFRRDREARSHLLRLKHWMDSEMSGKPLSFIEDEIAVKLEAYRFALEKHGIETAIGSFNSVLDWRHLLATSTSAATGSLVSGEALWGAIAAGGVVVGNVGIQIASAWLKLEEVKRGQNSEVAFVHGVAKRK